MRMAQAMRFAHRLDPKHVGFWRTWADRAAKFNRFNAPGSPDDSLPISRDNGVYKAAFRGHGEIVGLSMRLFDLPESSRDAVLLRPVDHQRPRCANRLRPTRGRDLPFARHGFPVGRERHHINFGPSGLDRVVGQPGAMPSRNSIARLQHSPTLRPSSNGWLFGRSYQPRRRQLFSEAQGDVFWREVASNSRAAVPRSLSSSISSSPRGGLSTELSRIGPYVFLTLDGQYYAPQREGSNTQVDPWTGCILRGYQF